MRRIWRLWKNDKPVFIAALICGIVLIALGNFLVKRILWIESDDALVQGDFATLGAPIDGIVQRVFVDEHQSVRQGQVLCEIDPRERRLSLAQAQEQLKASFAVYDTARIDFGRAEALIKKGAITQQAYDRTRAGFENLKKRYLADLANVEAEQVNLNYASIKAPADGIIALRSAQPGLIVKKGDPLFGIVYPQRKWVIAKIKETDLNELHIGQKVKVDVDAIPGRSFSGRIENFSPSTEAAFAAVPPDFASGNFTKYVQRVPVKVAFDQLSPEENRLVRLGLSVNVRMRKGEKPQ